MAKIQDYDISRQDINVQDTMEDIKTILNRGRYEITVITSSSPSWTESVNGIMVLSIYGATTRLYISNMSATNKWTYFSGTDL